MVKGLDAAGSTAALFSTFALMDLTGKEVDSDESARRMAFFLKIANHEAELPTGTEVWHRFESIPEKFRGCAHVWEFSEEFNVHMALDHVPMDRFISHSEETTKEEPKLEEDHRGKPPQRWE